MKKPKNIPSPYQSTGTPIYRDTTGLPFLDGGSLVDKTDHGKLLNSVYASALGNYYAQGGMIKRADGSYSQRGLWDNIRANRGSGKEPTKQMLEQERKINREYRNGGQFPTPYSLPEDSFKQGGRNLHNSVYASSLAQYPAVYKYGGSFEMPRQQMYMPLDNVERYGGQQQNARTFSVEGENHKVYLKTSPTGNGEGVQGHIMVNHPTENKGQWDTIDLTQKAGAKTVAQGVAATKQWHAEHPNNYRDGGSVFYATNTPQLEGEGKDLTYPDGAYVYGSGGVVKTSHLFGPGGPINPTTQQSLAQFLNPEFQKIVQGREVTVRPSAYQLQQANRTASNYDPLLVKNLPSETTQKVAKQSMQAENLNQVVSNIERANTIKNQTDPGHLYKTMTDKQISNIISPELNKEAQAAVDRKVYPNLAAAQRDLLMGQEANRVRSAQNTLTYYPGYGYKDPRQSGPWNNYNDGAIESADWVWSLPLGVRALPSVLEGLGTIAAKEIPFLGTSIGTAADIYGLSEATASGIDAYAAHRRGDSESRNAALLNTALNLSIPGGTGNISKYVKNAQDIGENVGNYLTTQTPLRNAYKINPLAGRLGQYNRVVGQDAVDDILKSGLVRVKENAGVAQDLGPLGVVYRQTPYPSFAKAAPQKTYAEQVISEGKTPYIISTNRPMRVSTLGRHGKGSTQFPVDEAGKYMTGFPASEAKVFEFGEPHWLKGYKEVPNNFSNISNTSKNILPDIRTPFINELIGSVKNKNRTEQLREAENWINSWIQHPATQEKILNSYTKALEGKKLTPTEKYNLEQFTGYSANYNAQNRLGEYPLWRQNFGKNNIHSDNTGVSYTHFELPGQILSEPINTLNSSKNFIESDPLELKNILIQSDPKYGNWVSRTLSPEKRLSVGVHELSHDWVKDYVLKNTELAEELTSGLDDFKIQEIIDKYKGTEIEEQVKQELEYLTDPTELFARLMEARRHFNLSPEQKITPNQVSEYLELIAENKTPIHPGFGKIISRGQKGADFFNNPWLWTGIGISGTQLGNTLLENNNNKKEFKKGGTIRTIKSSQLL